MTEHRLVADAEAEKVQHVVEAVGFFTHTCGYQPGCLCTEMYPARIKRLLATRAFAIEGLEEILRRDFAATEDIATIDQLDGRTAYERGVLDVQEALAPLLAELHGEKP